MEVEEAEPRCKRSNDEKVATHSSDETRKRPFRVGKFVTRWATTRSALSKRRRPRYTRGKMVETAARRVRKRTVFRSLREPKVAVMLLLGFSSGLPFLLTGNTLGYWLRDEGTTLAAIGFLSWVGLAYSLKFLWAPVVDRRRRAAVRPLRPPPRLDDRQPAACRAPAWSALSIVGLDAGLAALGASRWSSLSPPRRRTSSSTRGVSKRRATPTSSACCRRRTSSATASR